MKRISYLTAVAVLLLSLMTVGYSQTTPTGGTTGAQGSTGTTGTTTDPSAGQTGTTTDTTGQTGTSTDTDQSDTTRPTQTITVDTENDTDTDADTTTTVDLPESDQGDDMDGVSNGFRASVNWVGIFPQDKNGDDDDTGDPNTDSRVFMRDTSGVLGSVGYGWSAASVNFNYGWSRNHVRFLTDAIGPTFTGPRINLHEFTGDVRFQIPMERLRPFVLVGGGVLVFDPTDDNAGLTGFGGDSETAGTFLYGGGLDFMATETVGFTAGYRGLVHDRPELRQGLTGDPDLGTGHIAEPFVGVTFNFGGTE
jgi:hypothetical protein